VWLRRYTIDDVVAYDERYRRLAAEEREQERRDLAKLGSSK